MAEKCQIMGKNTLGVEVCMDYNSIQDVAGIFWQNARAVEKNFSLHSFKY